MTRELLELLARVHGVQFEESTSDEELQKKLTESLAGSGQNNPPAPVPAPTPPAPTPTNNNPHMTPALLNELRQRAEEDNFVKALLADYEDTRKQVAALTAANRLSEVRRKLTDVGDARRALTPHVSQELSELVAAMPPKAGDAVLGVVKKILSDGGIIELGERGRASVDESRDSVDKFNGLVRKLQEENSNIDYADAVSLVSANHPDLFESYRRASTADWR